VRARNEEVLGEMSAVFDSVYARRGRYVDSVAEAAGVRMLQMFYSVRSERLLRRRFDCTHAIPLVQGAEPGLRGVRRDQPQHKSRLPAEGRPPLQRVHCLTGTSPSNPGPTLLRI